jgi:hypothetical protein
MDAIRLSRAALALLIGAGLVGGILLGSVVTAFVPPEAATSQAPTTPEASASTASLPGSDVSGEDFARLPRYPGSVRTEYELTRDDAFRLTAVEYFADHDLDAVRGFYQTVISEHGWQRADITYSGGEWTYLLVDGGTDALIELEVTRGFVEIDIQVSEPIGSPEPSPAPTPRPNQPAATPPPAPAPPDEDDEGEDDGADDGDDSDGAGGGTDD